MSLNFLFGSFIGEEQRPGPVKKKEDLSLSGLLQRERLRLKRKKVPRLSSVYFNPSTIVRGYCKRLKVAQLIGLTEIYVDEPTPKLELMFDMGHAIHDIIQGYFWKIGLLEGDFQCTKCNKTWWAIAPKECPFVKSHKGYNLRYREIPLKDEKLQISGRADGILALDPKTLIEIKSIGNRTPGMSDRQVCFEDLIEGPKEDHVVQLVLYMYLTQIYIGHIIYVAKNTHQIKTFEVKGSAKMIDPYLDDIEDTISWAKEILDGTTNKLPDPCTKVSCTCENLKFSRS